MCVLWILEINLLEIEKLNTGEIKSELQLCDKSKSVQHNCWAQTIGYFIKKINDTNYTHQKILKNDTIQYP